MIRKRLRAGEDGQALVEMALSLVLLLAMIFCVVQVCFVLYAYNAVSEAAREATRYTIVRGASSCGVLSTFPNCNLGPTTSGNPLQTYVQSLGYPMANAMSVTPTWWAASLNGTGSTVWTTACTTLQDSNLNYCNQAGNQVKVVVTYTLPFALPFVPKSLSNITLSSTSEMMISE